VFACLYISVNLWNNVTITNLLNKTTNKIDPITINNAFL
jgi:hypothetical protein